MQNAIWPFVCNKNHSLFPYHGTGCDAAASILLAVFLSRPRHLGSVPQVYHWLQSHLTTPKRRYFSLNSYGYSPQTIFFLGD